MSGSRRASSGWPARSPRLSGPSDCLLAGGLAVMAHGFVRATRDVDILTRLPLSEARVRLEASGSPPASSGRPARGRVHVPERRVRRPAVRRSPAARAGSLGRGAAGRGQGSRLAARRSSGRPAGAQAQGAGPKDLMDAAILVLLHPETEAQALELATAYRPLDRFEAWLRDPRTQAQARRGSRACERRTRKAPRRRGNPRLDPSAAPCFHEGDGTHAPDARRRAGRPGPRGRAAGSVWLCAGALGLAARRRARVLRARPPASAPRTTAAATRLPTSRRRSFPRPLPPTPRRGRSPPGPSPCPPCSRPSARPAVPLAPSPPPTILRI